MKRHVLAVLGVVLALIMLAGQTAAAQTRSVFWERWDVAIDNIDTTNNRFDVVEVYDIRFDGTFRFGSAVIPDERLEQITNIRVYEDGRLLRESCSEEPGTYCVTNVVEGTSIVYYFQQPITDGSQTFRLEYTVVGALRVYEDGDQLWWTAIPEDHFGFSIGSSTITVELPDGFGPREGIDPVVTYGAPGEISVRGETVTAVATRQIGGNEAFEIRVQYPHDPDARIAAWQADFDAQREFDENVRPLIDVGLIAVSLLVAIGGPLGVFAIYYSRGRDPEVGPVPEFLAEPPSDLPPAVVGTLVDERADTRDVLSTLIHLGSRGYLVIEENRTENNLFGFGSSSSEFVFKRTNKDMSDLRSFERIIMQRVFGGSMEKSMSDLKDKFYVHMDNLKDDLYQELVDRELFTSKPSTTRGLWSGIGVAIIGMAALIGFLAFGGLESISGALLCFPAAIGLTGIVAAAAGQYMPAKTRKGAEEAAKWNAFREWMRNLDKYSDAEQVAAHFDRYLAYAIAFGMDRSWVQRFSKVNATPVPTWYFPTYWGGYYSRGYRAGTPIGRAGDGMPSAQDVLPGELAQAGGSGFSLDDMSTGLAGGLDSISNGLTEMLDSASRTLTSQPQQASSGSSGSWRSGGSSWSGGGFSGGGSSGGGSRGFG